MGMENSYVRAIAEGSEGYFRAFTASSQIVCHRGDIEWIMPVEGQNGPAIVYKVSLPLEADGAIAALVPRLLRGETPSLWVLNPLSTPNHLPNVLGRHGFVEITHADQPEWGMTLSLDHLPNTAVPKGSVQVQRVETECEYRSWIDVVNRALHGWDLLTFDSYRSWLSDDAFSFFLGHIDGVPVCTAATIRSGESASLEFVSTLASHRRKGAARAVCEAALRHLKAQGVRLVTLRSSYEAHGLYEKLGFVSHYEQRLFRFQAKEMR